MRQRRYSLAGVGHLRRDRPRCHRYPVAGPPSLSRNVDPSFEQRLEALGERGHAEVELFHKRGRSRALRWGHPGHVSSLREEEGWAVRAGDSRRSLFFCSSGPPDPDAPLPEADGQGLRLPSPRPVPAWSPPPELDSALLGENEAHGLFDAIARELDTEFAGARLVRGYLEDGSSEEQLASSREMRARVRRRAASLFVEARGPRTELAGQRLLLAERDARRFNAPAIARRLADRLVLAERGSAPSRDRGSFLLAPEIVVALLRGLSRLWIGAEARAEARQLIDRQGRFGSRWLTLADDGRLAGAPLESPVDGEGLPTREILLVEEGVYRQPLLAWHESHGQESPRSQRWSGCRRRASWRDLPVTGPSHLYLKPEPSHSVASLLADLGRGYYLTTADGVTKVEEGYRRFAVPVSGFAIDRGQPTGWITGAWLTGTVTALLTGIVAVARDLAFVPAGSGLWGSPTVLTKGLEIRHRF
ncbi:MAG: metallopeptidase TldD-related protein [Holophagales bacterium]|nr:metallopeptidase TldD-related protein [Holophagales bacterium]